jgi:hypothetical protein
MMAGVTSRSFATESRLRRERHGSTDALLPTDQGPWFTRERPVLGRGLFLLLVVGRFGRTHRLLDLRVHAAGQLQCARTVATQRLERHAETLEDGVVGDLQRRRL